MDEISSDSSDGEDRAQSKHRPSKRPMKELSPEERAEAEATVQGLRAEGNASFSAQQYEDALQKYTAAIKLCASSGLPPDAVVLCNRAAAYLALKRYVPACHDAAQAAAADPSNWKAHWRQGVALMAMAKRKFRTRAAIEAFERCEQCASLPDSKRGEVAGELARARALLQRQDDETPMPDMSNCMPS